MNESKKPVLEIPKILEEYASRGKNYFNVVANNYYDPRVPIREFTPSCPITPITPIDSLRYAPSHFGYEPLPYFQDVGNGTIPFIVVDEVALLHIPDELDDFVLGKLNLNPKRSDLFEPPEPPALPPVQQLYRVDLPEPVLNLPEVQLTGIKHLLFDDFLRKKIRNKYAKEIAQYEEWVKKRVEIIAQYEEWNRDINASNQALMRKYNAAKKEYDDALATYQRKAEADKKQLAECEPIYKSIQAIRQDYQSFTKQGIETYFDLVLKRIPFPRCIPKNWEIGYSADNRIIIIDYQFPVLDKLQIVKFNSRVRITGEWKQVNKTERKQLAPQIHPSLALRIAYEVARYDDLDAIDAIVVNGWLQYADKVTGHTKETYCSSLFSKKSDLLTMNLSAIDPIKCFQAFKGRSSGNDSYDIAPITPILPLDMDDKRFVDAREVLKTLNKDKNIATMDWEDFEHLVRELFERLFAQHGAEVKVTQAGRDLGVDAVIFDPTPIKGGKTVIQAKRYVNVVDVSAVRDLFGTVMNEGANKGILVTTSYYGPESYEFAKDKPLELINGQQLLGLLEQYGYKFRINLDEARVLNKEQSIKNQ